MAAAIISVQQVKPMLDLLQEAASIELTVSQHYWARAAYWRGFGVKKLVEMYEKEAEEERGHAKLVTDRAVFLGKQPTLEPDKEAPTQGSLREQMTQDLAGEVVVADRYVAWVKVALDAGDFVTMNIFKQILKETEAHVDWLQGQLKIAGELGDELFLARWVD
jgi:bacterioferritin